MSTTDFRRTVSHQRRGYLATFGLILASVLAMGTGLPSTTGVSPAATRQPFPDDLCQDEPPAVAVACFSWYSNSNLASSVVAMRTGAGRPVEKPLLGADQVGSVWGLANRTGEAELFLAAFHKRSYPFGPGGPGQVYKLALATGVLKSFVTVPNSGTDVHDPPSSGGNDVPGRNAAGKTSLGDIEISADGSLLFVVNLFNRRIYRYQLPSGLLLGSFAHGAAAETWAADARPFGLGFHDGQLYHGVVNSAESTQRDADLEAVVYASQPDGSDLHEVARLRLGYSRGEARIAGVAGQDPIVAVPIAWHPWRDGYSSAALAQLAVYPQPILADIEFTASGDMLLGLRDRQSDVSLATQYQAQGTIEKPGLGVGDLLLARRRGDRWEPVLPDGVAVEPYRDTTSLADSSVSGGLAVLGEIGEVAAAGLMPFTARPGEVAQSLTWFATADGNRLRRQDVNCGPYTAAPTPVPLLGWTIAPVSVAWADDEWDPTTDMGDVAELSCRRRPTPTVTDTAVPPDTVTPTPTSTATTTSTAPPTALPTATPTRAAYLPLALGERCPTEQQHVDVILVLDTSSSMAGLTSAGRAKIDAARSAVRAFLDQLAPANDQAALVWFNAGAGVAHGLTADRAALSAALDRLPMHEYTRIHLGFDQARSELAGSARRPGNAAAVILLSDGRSNPDPAQLAVDAAARLKAMGVTVFTIGLGSDLDAWALAEMASSPVNFRRAGDAEDLADVYRQIARDLPCSARQFFPRPAPTRASLLNLDPSFDVRLMPPLGMSRISSSRQGAGQAVQP